MPGRRFVDRLGIKLWDSCSGTLCFLLFFAVGYPLHTPIATRVGGAA